MSTGDEQGDDELIEFMKHVAGEATGGENNSRDTVIEIARRQMCVSMKYFRWCDVLHRSGIIFQGIWLNHVLSLGLSGWNIYCLFVGVHYNWFVGYTYFRMKVGVARKSGGVQPNSIFSCMCS